MDKNRKEELMAVASEVRKDIVRMVGVARSGPLDIPLSLAEVLVFLYWEEMLIVAEDPRRDDRDRFLLGMKDAVPALYAVLAKRGYFKRDELWHYRRLGAILQALPDPRRVPGIDAPCITVGPELAVASALADSLAKDKLEPRVFCLSGCDVFQLRDFHLEAKRVAKTGLDNLFLLISLSAKGKAMRGGDMDEHKKTMCEYGWAVLSVDGGDFDDMERVFSPCGPLQSRPKVIFIDNKNGSGISFVDAKPSRHARSMSMDDMDQALEELEGNANG